MKFVASHKVNGETVELYAESEDYQEGYRAGFEEGKKRQAVEKVPADDGAFEMSKMSLDWNSGYNWVLEEVIAKLSPKNP
jgi:hypothetical protein